MTKDEFINSYTALQALKREADSKIAELKREYAASFPFKTGDCVRLNVGSRCIEKCWIAGIEIHPWALGSIDLVINKPRKDGTRSGRMTSVYGVKISDVELLTDEPC